MMQGPTVRFSMMGNGGPLCARAGVDNNITITDSKQIESVLSKCGCEVILIVIYLRQKSEVVSSAHHHRGPHFHGLKHQPHRRHPEDQGHGCPGDEGAHW